jgi:hypothetical protein
LHFNLSNQIVHTAACPLTGPAAKHLNLKIFGRERKKTMMKKAMTGLLAAFLTLIFIQTATALEPGNDRKGKYTYRKVYKACMERGEVETPRPTLNPDAKTMDQWTRVFEKQDFGEFGCQQEWSQLSEEDISDIYAYLYKHAADSPTPAKCK